MCGGRAGGVALRQVRIVCRGSEGWATPGRDGIGQLPAWMAWKAAVWLWSRLFVKLRSLGVGCWVQLSDDNFHVQGFAVPIAFLHYVLLLFSQQKTMPLILTTFASSLSSNNSTDSMCNRSVSDCPRC